MMRLTLFDLSLISVIIALLFGFIERVRVLGQWIISIFFVRKVCNRPLAYSIIAYLDANSTSKSKYMSYGAAKVVTRPLAAISLVAYRVLWGGNRRFHYRGFPIWHFFDVLDKYNQHAEASYAPYDGRDSYHYQFGFIRWTIDWERLIVDATRWVTAEEERTSRFKVIKLSAATVVHDGAPKKGAVLTGASLFSPDRAKVPIEWSSDEIGDPVGFATLDRLELNQEATQALEEIKIWFDSKMWFFERGIPWCRKYGLVGEPGTGKTSFARAIAIELGIPVYSIDLTTMTNDILVDCWENSTKDSPCMILLEDVDSVFEGRINKTNSLDKLSFDCLLNCLDGVSQNSSGILIMISTNHLDKLDPALRRAGRMDRIINFGQLSYSGRLKLALRILEDQRLAEDLANSGHGMSPADFQELCFRKALELKLGISQELNGN